MPTPPRPGWRVAALVGVAIGSVMVGSGCASQRAATTAPSSSMAADAGEEALAPGAPTWTITFVPGGDVDVGGVATRLCFAGPPPPRVGPEYGRALRYLSDLPRAVDAQGRPFGPPLSVVEDGRRSGIDTSGLPPGACVAFEVDLEAAAKGIDNRDVAAVVGRAVLATPDVWLWRPKPWPAAEEGRLIMTTPASLAAPFPCVDDDDGTCLPDDPRPRRIRSSTFALQSYTALGDFRGRRSQRQRRGTMLQVVRLTNEGLDATTLSAWLDVAIDDVSVPLLRFPVKQATVIVVPATGARPVLAGFLGRGGGASAVFYVGKGPIHVVDDPEIIDEEGQWVLTHELAHALLPPVVRQDAWFNEGLTTWHQEVLPAAAGRRGRDVADAQLRVGFRTGARRSRADGLSLQRSCVEMDARGSYQHCYWGGAALAALLAAEVGDDGVFALVRAVHALGPIDGPPSTALSLLERASTSAVEPAARRAATALMALWRRHKDGLFPDVAAPATDGGPVWHPDT